MKRLLIAYICVIAAASVAEAKCGTCGQDHAHEKEKAEVQERAEKKAINRSAMVVASGYSSEQNSLAAGVAAATQAKEQLGKARPKLVLVYDRKEADHEKVLEGVCSVFDAGIVYGSAGYAPISQHGNKGTVSVMVFGGRLKIETAESDLEGGLRACGKRLGKKLKSGMPKRGGHVLLLLGECHVPKNNDLVEGVRSEMGDMVRAAGAASAGGFQYYRGKIVSERNIGVLITGAFTTGHSTMDAGDDKDKRKENTIAGGHKSFNAARDGRDGKIIAAMAFDCGGRRGHMQNEEEKELAGMLEVLGEDVPLAGFYGSGEIGPKDNESPAVGVGYHISAVTIHQVIQ
jgi:small ligand-binding sensory domain FIST